MIDTSPHKRITRKRVYISGPLTTGGGNVIENVDKAIDAFRALLDLGYAPLCPHLTYYIDPANKIPHQTWMEIDLPWVSVADAVFRLPGESKGADLECLEAFDRGIPIYVEITKLAKELR